MHARQHLADALMSPRPRQTRTKKGRPLWEAPDELHRNAQ